MDKGWLLTAMIFQHQPTHLFGALLQTPGENPGDVWWWKKLPGFFQWAPPMSPHHLTPKHLQNTFRLCELSWEFLQHQRCRCSAKLRRPGHRAVQRGHYPTLRAFFRRPKIQQTRQPCPVEVQWGIQRNLPVDTGYGCLNEDEDKMRCNMVQHVSCFPFIGVKIGCTPSNYTPRTCRGWHCRTFGIICHCEMSVPIIWRNGDKSCNCGLPILSMTLRSSISPV